jgi:DNA topoisomerase VI subunit B
MPKTARSKKTSMADRAEAMAKKQREISISEFFTKNRHLLGFDNPRRALLTTIKEAVDNALDACEEAETLPEIEIRIDKVSGDDRFSITVRDNGPGIVKAQIPNIFAKLLYGSKFHTLKQSRGQQGLGISAAGMYGQLTTGKPVRIISRISKRRDAHYFELRIDSTKNRPEIVKDEIVDWEHSHGTQVTIDLEARYHRGRQSVDEYVKQTAIANPHLLMFYTPPTGDRIVYERGTKTLPAEPRVIKPHPYGVELGILIKMMKDSGTKNLKSFLTNDFSRVSARVADEIIGKTGLSARTRLTRASNKDAEMVYRAIQKTKIMAPPTNCISPIGEDLLLDSLKKEVDAELFLARTRTPTVYRGNPFLIEVGLALGGGLPSDELVKVMRFANRVPLLYQNSACAITKSVVATDWKKYNLSQARGALPSGPMIIMVHMASAWVPFTSESKDAIAGYPEITKEIRLALQECGRHLGRYIRRKRREADELKKRQYIEKYIPQIGLALQEILGLKEKERDRTVENLKGILERSRKL